MQEIYEELKVSDPDRAKELRKDFLSTGNFDNIVKCIRQHSKIRITDRVDCDASKNKLSFFRFYLTAGKKKSL